MMRPCVCLVWCVSCKSLPRVAIRHRGTIVLIARQSSDQLRLAGCHKTCPCLVFYFENKKGNLGKRREILLAFFSCRMFIFVGARHGRSASFWKCEKIKLFLSFFLRILVYKSEVSQKENEKTKQTFQSFPYFPSFTSSMWVDNGSVPTLFHLAWEGNFYTKF